MEIIQVIKIYIYLYYDEKSKNKVYLNVIRMVQNTFNKWELLSITFPAKISISYKIRILLKSNKTSC